MKKLALILAAILVVMSFPMMLMSNVSAAGATVTYTKGGAAKTTTTIADAINNADNNTTIYLTGGDYVLTARENWKIWNKTLSLDLGGNTIKSSGTASGQFQGNGRVINVGFDGATHGPGADKAGAITLLNGRFENAAGSPMFQLYSNMSLTFGEGCVVDLHSASLYGICVMQANSKVTFGNGSVVRNTLATPFASEEEAKTTFTDNSWYTGVGLNEGGCTLTFEEGCYVETSGATFKTVEDKVGGNIVVNGGTIITHYKAIFITGNADFSLTIKGGNFYNAIYCPTNGNPSTTGSLGKCNIITWIGSNGTLNISGSPKFYSLYEQTNGDYFWVGSGVTVSGTDPKTITPIILGQDLDQVSHLVGASCRTTLGTMGLRFQSTFNSDIVNAITVASNGNFKMGTMIAPKAYVDEAGEFTKEAFIRNGLNYLDVAAENGTYVDANGDTVVKAAIVNIKEANKTLDFVATAYIEWTDILGVTHRCYTNPHPTDADARNIVEVANAALEDVKTAPEGLYTNAVVIDGVAGYARITQEQVDALVEIVK